MLPLIYDRYYKEFMLEPRTSSIKCPVDRPLVRVKVVPASFGLEGFEDAVWEATEDLMQCSTSTNNGSGTTEEHSSDAKEEYCKAITFVVAAPDLFTDPSLMEGERSPQEEFEPDNCHAFSSTLREKLVMFSKMEGVTLLDDDIQLNSFHPLWKEASDSATSYGEGIGKSFPYPCVAVSTKIEV